MTEDQLTRIARKDKPHGKRPPEDHRKDGKTAGNPSLRNNNNNSVLDRQLTYRKRKSKKKIFCLFLII
jgi:hypothetical protein